MKNPGSRILKYETYCAMPWRNGRGSTLEIAREPASGEEFAWRLSLADIDGDADFSAYVGYSRALVLVAGTSLRLRFRGHGRRFLDSATRSALFEGDWQTHCSLPEGRCTDLSLIVRKGPAPRSVPVIRKPAILRLDTSRRVVLTQDLYGVLFVLDGSVAVTESVRCATCTLRARETLLLAPGPRRTLALRSVGPLPAELVVLRWRPG